MEPALPPDPPAALTPDNLTVAPPPPQPGEPAGQTMIPKASGFSRKILIAVVVLFAAIGSYFIFRSFAIAPSPTYKLDPYISRANQIDRFEGKTSIYNQPWRGYMETVDASKLFKGMGINYQLKDKQDEDAVMKTLSESGISAIRKEVPWSGLNDTETDINTAGKSHLLSIVNAAKKYNVTPVILLNANHIAPQPMAAIDATLAKAAAKGATSLTIKGSPSGLKAGYSGFDAAGKGKSLWGGVKAGALFKSLSASGSDTLVTISKPLPSALAAGAALKIATFKHLPLYPVGTPQFDDTADAWVKYAKLVASTIASTGISSFEIEIWNELTFGSKFLNISNYDPSVTNDKFRFSEGGSAWELANRTTKALKDIYGSKVKVIWGFSNTSFFQVKPNELPPNTDGMSYHPYHTGPKTLAEIVDGKTKDLLGPDGKPDPYVPAFTMNSPESLFAFDVKLEGLIDRKMAPWKRNALKPAGVTTFRHYFTEHGVNPKAKGITDLGLAMDYKAKAYLKMYLFWMNKGLDQLDVFTTTGGDNSGYGMMDSANPATLSKPLATLKNLKGQFSGMASLNSPRQLSAEVSATGSQYQVFAGQGSSPGLEYRELFTLLPFQVNDNKFVVGAYVLNPNDLNPLKPMTFNVKLSNLGGAGAKLSYYDPFLGSSQPINVLSRDANSVTIEISAVDYPRLIVIEDSGSGSTSTSASSSTSSTSSSSSSTSSGGGTLQPVITLSASPTEVSRGDKSTLKWKVTNATTITKCTASGGWSGSKALEGTQLTKALTKDTTYKLACTNGQSNPSVTASVTVKIKISIGD